VRIEAKKRTCCEKTHWCGCEAVTKAARRRRERTASVEEKRIERGFTEREWIRRR